MKQKGFTLVELLMVIAIIALLASISLGSLGNARAKSRDAQVIREMQEVRTALGLYLNDRGYLPNETNISSNPYTDNFTDMAQELVSVGFLSKLPVAPAGHTYNYYNSGPTNFGGVVFSTLETRPSSTGYSGSCRPFPLGSSPWCTPEESNDYCICLGY